MGRPRKETEPETPQEEVIDTIAEAVPDKDWASYKCINLNNFLKPDSEGRMMRIRDNVKPNVDQSQVIKAAGVIKDEKKNAYIFIDGELKGRQEGENVIATFRPIRDWEIIKL
jgi:hypothetical protein